MCGVNEAMAVLSIMNSVNDFQAGKAKAKADRASNEITKANTNMSYMNDLNKIEFERIEAAREMSLTDFGRKMELRKQQAQALNLGFGNPFKVVQDIMGRGDTDYVELQNAFLSDMYKANYQYDQAYSDFLNKRNRHLKTVSEPSVLGLGLQIATTAGAYAMSPNSIVNQSSKAEMANKASYGWGVNAQRKSTGNTKALPYLGLSK
jgi:hypothetical protein